MLLSTEPTIRTRSRWVLNDMVCLLRKPGYKGQERKRDASKFQQSLERKTVQGNRVNGLKIRLPKEEGLINFLLNVEPYMFWPLWENTVS